MSKNTELQEEFEALISELGRLKSINEITSENSNNAKKTIDEIESFVQSVNILKTSITEDYKSKKKDLEFIETSLKEVIRDLVTNTKEQTLKFESLSSNYIIDIINILESAEKELEGQIKEYASDIKKLSDKLDIDIKKFTQINSKKIDDQTIIFEKSLMDKQNEILENFQQLNMEVIANNKQVKKITFLVITIIIMSAIGLVFYYLK